MITPSPRPNEPSRRVRLATMSDLSYVYSLQARYHDEVGYCPRGGLIHRIDTKRILIVEENDSPAGYVSATHRRDGRTHLTQIAIDPWLWRTTAGTVLLRRLTTSARMHGSRWMTLKCAQLLPANEFWTAQGFAVTEVRREQVRPLNCYAKALTTNTRFPPTAPSAQLEKMNGLR